MWAIRVVWTIISRGIIGHGGAVTFLAECASGLGYPSAKHAIWANLAGFLLVMIAVAALRMLLDEVVKPREFDELLRRLPCEPEQWMLDLRDKG